MQLEMIPPPVKQRVKEPSALSTLRIPSVQSIRFMETAMRTLQNKVLKGGDAASRSRVDVIDMKDRALSDLAQAAVPASPLVTFMDFRAQITGNG